SPEARQVADAAVHRALETGGADVDSVHLLWSLLRYPVTRELIQRTDAQLSKLEEVIDQAASQAPRSVRGSARLTPSAKRALLAALQIARASGSAGITPEHILFALGVHPDHPVSQLLRASGLTPQSLQQASGSQHASEQGESDPSC